MCGARGCCPRSFTAELIQGVRDPAHRLVPPYSLRRNSIQMADAGAVAPVVDKSTDIQIGDWLTAAKECDKNIIIILGVM